AVAGAVALALMPIGPQAAGAVLALLAWTGGLINAVQTTMYALAANVYPSAGSWALESGGSSRYFGLIGAAMVMAFVALSAIRRHIPGATVHAAASPI